MVVKVIQWNNLIPSHVRYVERLDYQRLISVNMSPGPILIRRLLYKKWYVVFENNYKFHQIFIPRFLFRYVRYALPTLVDNLIISQMIFPVI